MPNNQVIDVYQIRNLVPQLQALNLLGTQDSNGNPVFPYLTVGSTVTGTTGTILLEGDTSTWKFQSFTSSGNLVFETSANSQFNFMANGNFTANLAGSTATFAAVTTNGGAITGGTIKATSFQPSGSYPSVTFYGASSSNNPAFGGTAYYWEIGGQGLVIDQCLNVSSISMQAGANGNYAGISLDNSDTQSGWIQWGKTVHTGVAGGLTRLAQISQGLPTHFSYLTVPVLAVQAYVASGGHITSVNTYVPGGGSGYSWDLGALFLSEVMVDHIDSASGAGIYLFDGLRLNNKYIYDSNGNYGNSGQYLQSQGSTGGPIWSNPVGTSGGYGGVNQTPIDSGSGWWGDTGSNPNFTITTYSSQTCWKGVMPSSNSAIDYGPITVAPTDRIIFFAWIATSTGDAGSYARLGMDFVDSAMTEYNQPSYGTQGTNIYVGTSTLTLTSMDMIVSSSYNGNQGYGVGNPFTPAGVQPWCQIWGTNGYSTNLTAYFANIVCYIISSGDPAYSQPTSYFTSLGGGSGSGSTFISSISSNTPLYAPSGVLTWLTNVAAVVPANLTGSGAVPSGWTLPYAQLTSVPTSFVPSAHASSHLTTGSDSIYDQDLHQSATVHFGEVITSTFAFSADTSANLSFWNSVGGGFEGTTPTNGIQTSGDFYVDGNQLLAGGLQFNSGSTAAYLIWTNDHVVSLMSDSTSPFHYYYTPNNGPYNGVLGTYYFAALDCGAIFTQYVNPIGNLGSVTLGGNATVNGYLTINGGLITNSTAANTGSVTPSTSTIYGVYTNDLVWYFNASPTSALGGFVVFLSPDNVNWTSVIKAVNGVANQPISATIIQLAGWYMKVESAGGFSGSINYLNHLL